MIKFERDDGRYYYMSIEHDLFGDIVLRVLRGGRRTSLLSCVASGSMGGVIEKAIQLSKRRLQRGYIIVQ